MPDFETLDQAVEAYTALEVKVKELEGEKTALLRKRDELLGELKTTKSKYARFADYADREDIDISELLDIKSKFESGTSDAKTEYEKAYERDKKKFEERLASIEAERAKEKAERERERQEAEAAKLKAAAISELTKESYRIRNPEQFWILFGQGKVQASEDGKLFVGDEYKQIPLNEYVEQISGDENSAHHFKPRGGSGSGTAPNSGGGQGKIPANPFKPGPTFSLTEQGRIFRENRALAERLKAEAGQ